MRMRKFGLASLAVLVFSSAAAGGELARHEAMPIDWEFGVKIPMRDGIKLDAILYHPSEHRGPVPCLFALTPYTAQTYHERAAYFASNGYVALSIDVRGRGNSEGDFRPLIQEARDGEDVVNWLARQPYCNGKIAMWGGSYGGYDQWATASRQPKHLVTIVPTAAPVAGVDFPMDHNIARPLITQWFTLVSGRTVQIDLLEDRAVWVDRLREHFVQHRPFIELVQMAGSHATLFREYAGHPQVDSYWDAYNPTSEQYARIDCPVLTITGQFDDDQAGALEHYRRHVALASKSTRANHFLIIGPWDHGQTYMPRGDFGGLKFNEASALNMNQLHVDWYNWTLKEGPRPGFLKKRVAYYMTGAEAWRYADSLEELSREPLRLYLVSQDGHANEPFQSGSLRREASSAQQPDQFVYDPLDVSSAEVQAQMDPNSLTEQRDVLLSAGTRLIYHGTPFIEDTEIGGFFHLNAWISLDQPDTDFAVQIYQIQPDGNSVLLTSSKMRARYRNSLREANLVRRGEVLEYRFDFPFVARQLVKGSRLRMVVGSLNSMYWEKNYNGGGDVAHEGGDAARSVTVRLYHDARHPSALYVPISTTMPSELYEPSSSRFRGAH